jgi:hypothetical protein
LSTRVDKKLSADINVEERRRNVMLKLTLLLEDISPANLNVFSVPGNY